MYSPATSTATSKRQVILLLGFPESKVYEVHGTINYSQCNGCSKIEAMPNKDVEIDMGKFKCTNIPKCTSCSELLRPNILMFSDYEYIGTRNDEQQTRYGEFIKKSK